LYISHLMIQNYRNFTNKNFDIDLKPFTVIIGENNSGKTNLLNALGLIFNNEISFFKKRMLEIDDINYKSVLEFKKNIANLRIPIEEIEFPEVRIEVTMKEFTSDQEAIVADWFIDTDLIECKLTYVFSNRDPKRREWIKQKRQYIEKVIEEESDPNVNTMSLIESIDFPIKNYDYIIYGGLDESKQVDGYFLKMLRMECLDALRDAKRELVASGDYRLLYKILKNRDEEKYADLKKKLKGFERAIEENEELNLIRSQIGDYLDTISQKENSGINNINFQFSSIEISELLKKLSLIYGIDPINVERNGMGRNNLLYISLIISHLYANSSLTDNVFFRIIGIEEPEAHLHPHLQEHLGKSFQKQFNKFTQIIITSHSTHITSKLDLDNIVILYEDGENEIQNHYILSNFGSSADDKRTIQYLKKFLDATNSTMFFSRKIILVEGIAEQLLIPLFYKKINKDTIERIGCNIVNVNGLAFKNYLDIIKNGYFVKCIVLTDSDDGTKSENRAENLFDKYSQCPVIHVGITEESTFEKDLIKVNSRGLGKKLLIKAFEETRPNIFKKSKDYLQNSKVDDEYLKCFYEHIEKYKSEFAYNLANILNEFFKNDNFDFDFKIPPYIEKSFIFLKEECE
jgi:putative ATP-dependent endonuclease of the OLD family